MKYTLLILLLCLLPAQTFAQDAKSSTAGFENDVTRREEEIEPSTAPIPVPGAPVAHPKSFMTQYCDPAFVPMLANNQKYFGQEPCLKLVRDNACGRFKALAPEVQSVLDEAIGCLFANSNGYAVDKNQDVSNESVECGASYMHRIDMLKKYYTDYYANNALLFLPDDVLDTPGRCVRR